MGSQRVGHGWLNNSNRRNISHLNNRKKTKSMSANISKFMSKQTIIPTLQMKPVLKRNTPLPGARWRLTSGREAAWCSRQGSMPQISPLYMSAQELRVGHPASIPQRMLFSSISVATSSFTTTCLEIWYNWHSVQFSHSVMSNSWRRHGLQHARPPCPSPTPRACPNSCILLFIWVIAQQPL